MIIDCRQIPSEGRTREIWKILRLFLNVEATVDRLRRIHNVPEGKHNDNLKKQAKQIGYCIRQGQEYFKAAEEVQLATRPLLLYYGCVALSQALILTTQDGSFSLDATRKSGKHRHHGLELQRGIAECAVKAQTPEEFFSMIKASLYVNDKGEPVGHFPLVYNSLAVPAFVLRTNITDWGQTSSLWRTAPNDCVDLLPLEQLIGKTLDCWQLIRTFPDLYDTLAQTASRPLIKPGEVSRQHVNYYAGPRPAPNALETRRSEPVLERFTITDTFFINALSESEKEVILNLYRRNPMITIQRQFPNNLHLVVERQGKPGEQMVGGYIPDIVDDLYGKNYFIMHPETYIPELPGMLVVMYCLGMLSRYFPDVWMTVTDSRVEIAELTNTLLGVVERKFPNLVLDQMAGVKHYSES